MLTVSGRSDVGRVRADNEDHFDVTTFPSGAVLAIVCDGMGGERGGEVASQTATEVIRTQAGNGYRPGAAPSSTDNLLRCAAAAANTVVYDMAQNDPGLRGMGTTVLIALVEGDLAVFASAGDSRIYLVSHGEARQLTRDHTMVQDLVDRGELTPEQARVHPHKHYITRALGVQPQLRLDLGEQRLAEGDTLLLCTDGLSNYLEEADIARIVGEYGAAGAAQALIDEANLLGGADNSTVVLITRQPEEARVDG